MLCGTMTITKNAQSRLRKRSLRASLLQVARKPGEWEDQKNSRSRIESLSGSTAASSETKMFKRSFYLSFSSIRLGVTAGPRKGDMHLRETEPFLLNSVYQ